MKKVILGFFSILVFLLICSGLVYLFFPITHFAWIKPGVTQADLPKGLSGQVVFENINLLPLANEQVIKGQTLVVAEQRVTNAIDSIVDTYRINGKGLYLLPGLTDMHVHLFGVENDLLLYLANGVTQIRVLGQESREVMRWRDQIRDAKRPGPVMKVFWPMIESNNRGFAFGEYFASEGGKVYVSSEQELREIVSDAKEKGSDGIKVHGVKEKSVLMSAMKFAVDNELLVETHVPEQLTFCKDRMRCWQEFLEINTHSVAHLEEIVKVVNWDNGLSNQEVQQVAKDIAERKIQITSTVAFINNISTQIQGLEEELNSSPQVKYLHPQVFDGFWRPGHNDYQKLNLKTLLPYNEAHKRLIRAMQEAGVKLLAGSDASVPISFPGSSLLEELETMVDYGLTPLEALQTATINPAAYYKSAETFSPFRPGAQANFVLLRANPLLDIKNIRQIEGVMVNGRWFSRSDLEQMLRNIENHNRDLKQTLTIFKLLLTVLMAGLVLLSGYWLSKRVF
ncbi:amidohydrolase family protein [Aliikangiella sp. G2MR2-5]|uniref:amidohydrolase family protein n=1 Tax=Aliikangiella sp. G2MR2-5 TaxID=2788943 RepID=UPI0018AC46B1|nr:amidohydrolase family protein [Aliikangiella sp. G2MR2-5]